MARSVVQDHWYAEPSATEVLESDKSVERVLLDAFATKAGHVPLTSLPLCVVYIIGGYTHGVPWELEHNDILGPSNIVFDSELMVRYEGGEGKRTGSHGSNPLHVRGPAMGKSRHAWRVTFEGVEQAGRFLWLGVAEVGWQEWADGAFRFACESSTRSGLYVFDDFCVRMSNGEDRGEMPPLQDGDAVDFLLDCDRGALTICVPSQCTAIDVRLSQGREWAPYFGLTGHGHSIHVEHIFPCSVDDQCRRYRDLSITKRGVYIKI